MSIANINKNTHLNVSSLTFGIQGTSLRACATVAFNGSFTGPYGIHGPVPAGGLLRFYSGFVSVSFDGIGAQTDNNGILTFSTPLSPAPSTTMNFPIWVTDLTQIVAGNCRIDTNGIVTIYKGYNGTFTGASVNSGFPSFTVVYNTYSLS